MDSNMREKLLTVMGRKEAREALKKTADEADKELKRVTEQYEQGLTNAAMQGGKSLKEYVLGMLRTTGRSSGSEARSDIVCHGAVNTTSVASIAVILPMSKALLSRESAGTPAIVNM